MLDNLLKFWSHKKSFFHALILLSTFASTLTWTSTAVAVEEEEIAGQLPEDWFVLPEDRETYRFAEQKAEAAAAAKQTGFLDSIGSIFTMHKKRGEEETAKSIDRVLRYSGDALDNSSSILGRSGRFSDTPPDWVPWHLNSLILKFGISLQGTLGILTGNGSSATEVTWERTQAAKQALGLVPQMESANRRNFNSNDDFVVTEFMSVEEIERNMIPLTQAVLATRKIKKTSKVQANLVKVAKELQDVMVNVNFYNGAKWQVSELELEICLDAEGEVYYGVSVFGGIGLKFLWIKQDNPSNTTAQFKSTVGNSAKQEALRITMAKIGKDLESITSDLYGNTGFKLETIAVGVGLFFSTNIGMATGALSVMGRARFAREENAKKAHPLPPVIAEQELPFISKDPTPVHLNFAQRNGVEYERENVKQLHGAGVDKVIYYMNRPRFRSGLRQAAKMGSFFARQSAKADARKWRVSEVKTEFSLSLLGNLAVATVGGTVALELVFARDINSY